MYSPCFNQCLYYCLYSLRTLCKPVIMISHHYISAEYFYKGFQLIGFLQYHQHFRGAAWVKGERWPKEIKCGMNCELLWTLCIGLCIVWLCRIIYNDVIWNACSQVQCTYVYSRRALVLLCSVCPKQGSGDLAPQSRGWRSGARKYRDIVTSATPVFCGCA